MTTAQLAVLFCAILGVLIFLTPILTILGMVIANRLAKILGKRWPLV